MGDILVFVYRLEHRFIHTFVLKTKDQKLNKQMKEKEKKTKLNKILINKIRGSSLNQKTKMAEI